MDKSKIELIYEIIIQGLPLTKNTLIEYGLTEDEINWILEEGILIKTESNEYKLCCIYEFYYYGLKLITRREVKKANICFRICYKLKPNDRVFLLQELLSALKLGHYVQVFEKFSIMEKIESEKYQIDNNLYLYLLSMLTSCPEEYQERLYNLEYDSVLLPENSQEYNKKRINDIRHSIMKNKFGYALEILNSMMIDEPIRIIEQELLKELILQVMRAETKFKLKLLSLAQEKNYKMIVSYLKTKSKKRYLSNKETYIYLISKAILDVLAFKSAKEVTVRKTKYIYEAIKGNNFELASRINNIIIRRENNPLDNQIMTILLRDLNELIRNLKPAEEEIKEEPPKTPIITVEESLKETKELQSSEETDYIDVAEDLAYFIQTEALPLEVALKEGKITEEQSLLIKLIYARDYYTEEMYLLGDILLKEVEKSNNKTLRVKKLLNEVRANKKFYKHRIKSHKKTRTINN